MRVAYLTGEYPRATDTFVQREVAHLRRLGARVTTISVRRPDSSHRVGPEQCEEARRTQYLLPASPVKVIRSHMAALRRSPGRYIASMGLAWRTRRPGLAGLAYQAFYFVEAGLVCGVMRQERAGHLHNHFANSSCTVSMLASTMGGFPYSFTMHGPAIFFEPKLWRIDEKIARSRFVACISHFCRSQGMAFVQTHHWPKMRIVHCGVDPAMYPLRQHAGQGIRLVFVGRLAPVKGLPVLLEAMTRLNEDVSLTVVGDGEDRGLIENRITALGLGERVDLVGYKSQDEVRDILGDSDVFVMASFAEGVPVVLMEAMASGLPVVATRIAGVAELVEDAHNGYLVAPGDPESLAKRLGQLLEDAVLRRRLGSAGRRKVESEFNIDQEAAWLWQIMQGQAEGRLRPDDHQEDTRSVRDKAGDAVTAGKGAA